MLESKLDGLAAQLSILTRQQGPSAVLPSESDGLSARRAWSSVPAWSSTESSSRISPPSGATTAPWESPHDGPQTDCVEDGSVSQEDARERLKVFQASYVPYCPFVATHPAHTMETFRKEFPTTFLAIVALMESSNSFIRTTLREKLQHRIYGAVLNGDASPDLLRALLIFVVWHQYFNDSQKSQIFLLLQLCLTLVHQLGLEKATCTGLGTFAQTETGISRDLPQTQVNSDEKRLLLGAYWLSV